jgi:hypothetical protein
MTALNPWKSDLWHRTAFGKLPDNAWAGFRHGGNVIRVGKATFWKIKFIWDDDSPGKEMRDAVVRVYELARPTDKDVGKYDTMLFFAWTLTYDQLIRIPGFECVPQHTLEALKANKEIFLCSDWLVSDGFECYVDVVPHIKRVSVGRAGRTTPALPAKVPGCPGMVKVTLVGKQNLVTIVDYEDWPEGVDLKDWHADPDYIAGLEQRKGFAALQPLAADQHGPHLDVPLGGGPEHPPGSGRTLVRQQDLKVAHAYPFKQPGCSYIEYIGIEGDPYADPIVGTRFFDERALTTMPTARKLLKPARANRTWLFDKFLLPSVDGAYPLTIPRAWLGPEPVVAVNPALSKAAAEACGVGNYFTFELVVGTEGLLPCPALTRPEARSAALRAFAAGMPSLQVVHAAMQRSLATKLVSMKRSFPFVHELSPFPSSWYRLLQNEIGIEETHVDQNAAVRDTILSASAIDKLYGAQPRRAVGVGCPTTLTLQSTPRRLAQVSPSSPQSHVTPTSPTSGSSSRGF